MIVMLSNRGGIEAGYLAGRWPGRVGHLFSPGAQRGPWSWMPYALDNGAFVAWSKQQEWDEPAWRGLLRWAQWSGQYPLWALVPDVVADRAGTLQRWRQYSPIVASFGFRLAFAVQDGMVFEDVPGDAEVLFLGGSTAWKESAINPWCEHFPGRVHVGRVNTMGRLLKCWRAGAVSVDGTGWFHRPQMADLITFLSQAADGSPLTKFVVGNSHGHSHDFVRPEGGI